jgi:hypothetical protein
VELNLDTAAVRDVADGKPDTAGVRFHPDREESLVPYKDLRWQQPRYMWSGELLYLHQPPYK